MINTLSTYLYKILFSVALIFLFLSMLEWCLNKFNYTLSWTVYTPFRLAEFGLVLMIFAIAFLLRQIRDKLK
jgi:hypothetical protein